MATIYTLTIDPVALGITKPVDRVYIKNLYVDTDDTHIRTAAFEYSAGVIGETAFAELPPTTFGSIYQIQLFGSEGMVLSVFFGMPERNALLSELDIYTAYPPRSFYPEATISWGSVKGPIADQTDLKNLTDLLFTKVAGQVLTDGLAAANAAMFTKAEVPALRTEIDNKIAANVTQVTGQSTALSPSQKLVTDNINSLNTRIDGARTHGTYYAVTTAIAPNTYIGTDGKLSRSTVVFGTVATKNVGVAAGQIPLVDNIPALAKTAAIEAGILQLQTDATQVTQVTGQSTSLAPSQKLLTDNVNSLNTRIDGVQGGGSYYNTTTTEGPNTRIAADGTLRRSTMVFGTAATRTVGTASGNLVEAQVVTAQIAANVTQATGQSTGLSVSQKLFTDTIGNIDAVLDSINGVVV